MPELSKKPLNREPELQHLIDNFLTPLDEAYDRNHGVYPQIDGSVHRIRVDGAVGNPLSLSVEDLKHNFEQRTVVCALQCAGNRRHTMRTKLKEVQGVDWFDAAVMNCKWRGPKLKDVLEKAGIALDPEEVEKAHVSFACYSAPTQESEWYGASVPLSRALREDGDILLALEMNDKPLTVGHGYPVRVVIPGIAGARAVKWLDRITVQLKESDNFYMQHDYKILPPEVTDSEKAEDYWRKVPPVQEMPVNSTIAVPKEGSTVDRDENGCITVVGYALPSGDNGPVTKVEVSADGGVNWIEAELLHHQGEGKWSWKLWQAKLQIHPGSARTIYSRATDAAGHTLPRRPQWNLRGVCYNGYGEAAEVTVK
jgi:sulfite oxidase